MATAIKKSRGKLVVSETLEFPEFNVDSFAIGKLNLQVGVIKSYFSVLQDFAIVIGLEFDNSFIVAKMDYLEGLIKEINEIGSYNELKRLEGIFSFYKKKIVNCKTKTELFENIIGIIVHDRKLATGSGGKTILFVVSPDEASPPSPDPAKKQEVKE